MPVSPTTGLAEQPNTLDLSNLNIKFTASPVFPTTGLPSGPSDVGINFAEYAKYTDPTDVSQLQVRSVGALNDMRAQNQGWLEKFGHGVTKGTLSIGTKLGEGLGYMGGGLYWLGKAAVDNDYSLNAKTFQDVYDNGFVNMFRTMDHSLKEALPVYATRYYEEGNLLQRMSTWKFWFDDGFDGLAFLASAYLGGGAVGALGKATLGKGLAKLPGLASNARMAGVVNNLSGFVPATAYNTWTEAGFEARDTRDQVMRELMSTGKYSEGEAKKIGAEAAAETFMGNAMILSLSNSVQMASLFGNPLKAQNKMFRDIASGKLKASDISSTKEVFKALGTNAVTEGLWEEGMQTALQSYEMQKALGKYSGDNPFADVAQEWLNGWGTREGQDSMVLGAVIGMLGGGFGAYRESKDRKSQIEKGVKHLDEWKKYEKLSDKSYIDYLKTLHKVNDKGKLILTAEGKPILNEEWLQNRAMQLLEYGEYENERIFHTLNNDSVALAYVDSMELTRKAYAYLNNPVFENVDEAFNKMIENLENDIQGYANETNQNADPAMAKLLQEVKPMLNNLKESYKGIQAKVNKINTGSTELDIEIKNKLSRMSYYIQSKIVSLKALDKSNMSEEAIQDLENSIKESETTLKSILNGGERRNQFIKEYKNKREFVDKLKKRQEEIDTKLVEEKDTLTPDEKTQLENEKKQLEFEFRKNKYIEGDTTIDRLSFNDGGFESNTQSLVGKRKMFNYESGRDKQKSYTLQEKLNNLKNQWLENKKKAEEGYEQNPEEAEIAFELSQDERQELNETLLEYFSKSQDPSYNYSQEDFDFISSLMKELLEEQTKDYNKAKEMLTELALPLFLKALNISKDQFLQDPNYTIQFNKFLEDIAKKAKQSVANPQDVEQLRVALMDDSITVESESLLTFSGQELVIQEEQKDNNDNVIVPKISKSVSKLIESIDEQEELFRIGLNYFEEKETLKHIEAESGIVENSKQDINNNTFLTKWKQTKTEEEREEILEKEFLKEVYNYRDIEKYIDSFKYKLKNDLKNDLERDTNINLVNYFIDNLETLYKQYKDKEFNGELKNIDKQILEHLNYLKDTIKEQIVKNLNNRNIVQARSGQLNIVQAWRTIGLNIEIDTNGGLKEIGKNPIYQSIKEIIGEEIFDNIIKESKDFQKNDNPYDIVYVEKILTLLKESKKDKTKILETVQAIKKEALNDLLENSFKNEEMSNGQKRLKEYSLATLLKPIDGKVELSISSKFRDYKSNPKLMFPIILNSVIPYTERDSPNFYESALYKFLQDNSIAELKFSLQTDSHKSTIPKEFLEKFVNAHIEYSSILELENYLKQDNPTLLNYLEKYKEQLKSQSITPNTQQEIALREAYYWFKGKKTFGYLRGIAGTGKTSVFLKYFIENQGIDVNNVLVTAHNNSAIESVKNSVNPNQAEKETLDVIITNLDKYLKGKTLLVIDEITANNEEILKKLFLDITAYNAKNEKKVKVLMMGDPTQINKLNATSVTRSLRLIELLYFTTATSNLEISKNFESFSPLTVPYRSDVGAINTLSNSYQDSAIEQSNLMFTHSKDITEPDTIGAYALNMERNEEGLSRGILQRIDRSKGNNRPKKAILVSNPQMLTAYKEYLNKSGQTDIEVLDYKDAQGKTFDEVYIDILKGDVVTKSGSPQKDNHTFNTAMYTAISRAKDLVIMVDETSTHSNVKNEKINESRDDLKTEKEELKKDKTALNDFRIEVLKKKIEPGKEEKKDEEKPEGNMFDDKKETPPQTEEEEDDNFENNPDADPIQLPPADTELDDPNNTPESDEKINKDRGEVLSIDKDSHIVAAPNGDAITKSVIRLSRKGASFRVVGEVGSKVGIPLLQEGSEIIYVRARTEDGKFVIKVFGRESAVKNNEAEINGTDNYVLVTLIRPENLRDDNPFESYLKQKFEEVKDDFFAGKSSSTTKTNLFKPNSEELRNFVIDTGNISYTRDIAYRYAPLGRTTKRGEGLIEFIQEKMRPLITKKDVLDQLESTLTSEDFYGEIGNVQIRIFSRKEIDNINAEGTEDFNKEELAISYEDAGFPFAIVDIKTGDGKPKKQFVRLDPVKLRKSNPMLQPLIEFYDSVQTIQNELKNIGHSNLTLGTNAFNKIANEYRHNYSPVLVGEENGKKKFDIERSNSTVVVPERIQQILEEYGINVSLEEATKIHQIFDKNSENIIKNMYSVKESASQISFNGYIEFINRQIAQGIVNKKEAEELFQWIEDFKKAKFEIRASGNRKYLQTTVTHEDATITEVMSEQFTEQEISLLLKMNKITTAGGLIYRSYSNAGIDIDGLPKPQNNPLFPDGRTFRYFKDSDGVLQKATFLQYRIRKLRQMLSSNSYIKIENGPNAGKYYAFDPLNGKVIVLPKILDRGFISISSAKKAGVVPQNAKDNALDYKEIRLAKKNPKAENVLDALVTANARIKDRTLRHVKTFNGKQVTFSPTLLSYRNEGDIDFNTKVLSDIRKSFNSWMSKNRRDAALLQKINEDLSYIHEETGEKVSMLVQPFKGQQKELSIGFLKRDIALENEQVFLKVLDIMAFYQMKLEDGRVVDSTLVWDLYNEQIDNRIENMSYDDLSQVLDFNNEGINESMRTPLNRNYVNSLSNKMNNTSKEFTQEEKIAAKQTLESMLETSLEQVIPTSVHIKSNNYVPPKSTSQPKPGEPGSRMKPEAAPETEVQTPPVSTTEATNNELSIHEEIVNQLNAPIDNKENINTEETTVQDDVSLPDDLDLDSISDIYNNLQESTKSTNPEEDNCL